MARGRQVLWFGILTSVMVLLVVGVTVRGWLKAQVEAAGSPMAFAAQTALSALEKKIQALGPAIAQDQQEQLGGSVQRLRGHLKQLNQPQTIRLFTALREFDERTKAEAGRPSPASIHQLISDLDTL